MDTILIATDPVDDTEFRVFMVVITFFLFLYTIKKEFEKHVLN